MWNTVWGLITIAILGVIIFVNAGKISGISGGDQSATIIKAMAGGGSQLINSLEGTQPTPGSTYYG